MKKLIGLLIMLLFITIGSATVYAADTGIIIDGEEIGASARSGMIPVQDVVEHMGSSVFWNPPHAIIRHDNITAIITYRSNIAIVNGQTISLAVAPRIANGQIMVSRCFLSEILGVGVGFINDSFVISSSPATQVPVLVYHHILPDEVNTNFSSNAWTISTENFAEQMRYLRDNGFYTPTLKEFESFLLRGRDLPANSVVIHFDDGYYSNYVYAYPILERYGFRAVLFPVTERTESLGEVQPPIDHGALTRAAAITLRYGTNIFETASHSHDLHDRGEDGRTLLVSTTREDIIADTQRSFEFVTNRRAYAYPLGMYNDTVISALREAGITMAFTVNGGYITPDSDTMRLPRFTIYRSTQMGRFRDIVNRRV